MKKDNGSQISELKAILKEGKVTLGTDSVLKGIRANKIARVYIANNCNSEIKEDLDKYSKLTGTEIINLSIPNDELGVVCKKPFSISILGVQR